MIIDKQEAVIHLLNGQRKYGSVLQQTGNGSINFLSFLNEQLFGIEQSVNHIECINESEIHEIDFCMK